MSILSALKEVQHDNNNLDDLAKLPQTLIMQMAQSGAIEKDMVLPILGRKAEIIETTAKMNAAKQLAAQGGVQPTVMDNYMGKIAQAENPAPMMPQQMMPQQAMAQMPMPQAPEDVGIASQATAPMQMAGGGIIAFSGEDGSYVDSEDASDDYQEAIDDAHEAEVNAKIYELIAKNSDGASSTENRGVGITAGHRGAERGMEDKGDMESRLRAAILNKESGGRRYDKEGKLLTSSKGAEGEMQVMPYTAKDPGFGIKPARNNSPDELRRVGDEYASMLLRRYDDPKVAMIAYNMGPGATDKWLAKGAKISELPKETQGYIRGVKLAKGGEVPGYASKGYVDYEDYYSPEGIMYAGPSTMSGKEYGIGNLNPDYKAFDEQEWEKKYAKKKPAPSKASSEEVEDFFGKYQEKSKAKEAPAQEEKKSASKEVDDDNFSLMRYIKDSAARVAKSEAQDKNMALLAAGLGMLGGTSSNAFTNIGQGAQMGVQHLAQSQKLRAGQEAALGKLYGSAAQNQVLNKLRQDQLSQGKELKEASMDQSLLTAKNNFIEKRLKALGMDEMMLGTLRRQQAMGKLPPDKLPELQYYEQKMKEIDADAERRFASPGAGSQFKVVGVR